MDFFPQKTLVLSRRQTVSVPSSTSSVSTEKSSYQRRQLQQNTTSIHGKVSSSHPRRIKGGRGSDSKRKVNTKVEWRNLHAQIDEASKHDESAKMEAIKYMNKIGATYEPTEGKAWSRSHCDKNIYFIIIFITTFLFSSFLLDDQSVSGVACYLITPQKISKEYKDTWFVHIHDGAFLFHGGIACIKEAAWMANVCQARVLSIDYLRPPLFDVVAAIDDCVKVWKHIIEVRQQNPDATALFGSSPGGNLTVATTIWLHEMGLPLPGVLCIGTPLIGNEKHRLDNKKTISWPTYEELEDVTDYGFLRNCVEQYSPPDTYAYCSSPLAGSMHHGDALSYFPPTILIASSRDHRQLSDTIRMRRALRNKGVTIADLHVFDAMAHGDDSNVWETLDAKTELCAFFRKYLQTLSSDETATRELERYLNLCDEIKSRSCLVSVTTSPNHPNLAAAELVEQLQEFLVAGSVAHLETIDQCRYFAMLGLLVGSSSTSIPQTSKTMWPQHMY